MFCSFFERSHASSFYFSPNTQLAKQSVTQKEKKKKSTLSPENRSINTSISYISPSDYSGLQKRCSFHLECILPLKVPHCGHFHISIVQPATRSQINYPRKKRPPTSAGSLVSAGYYRASRCSRKVGVSVFSCSKTSLTALRRRRGKKGHF